MSEVKCTHPPGWKAVRKFPMNTRGQDYVVGDLHGAFELLHRALMKSKFDPNNDRLFLCGDMVDRGEDSIKALRLLNLPCVFAVPGNHELAWMWLYDSVDVPGQAPQDDMVFAIGNAMRLGNGWWLKADPAERDRLIAKFRELPLAIEIETARGTVGIVHADVPDGLSWPDFCKKLEAGDEKVIEKALGSRKRIRSSDSSGVAGIGRVFFGHSIEATGPKQLGNTFFIDQGAIQGLKSGGQELGYLTMASLVCRTSSLTEGMDSASMLGMFDVIRDDQPTSAPFGEYARQSA